MFNKIKSIELLPDFIIKAKFICNVQKLYDLKLLFDKYKVFNPLRDIKGLFAQAQIDCGGHGIVWNDDIDIDANEVWYNGVTILNNEDDIQQYLKVVAEETNPEYIVKAINEVAKIKGFNNLAREMGVGRESLYKSLNGETKPRFETIYKALQALGLRLSIKSLRQVDTFQAGEPEISR